MSVLRAAADNVRAELAANPKLRLGVWTIVAILLGYWVFVPHAARVDRAAADYATVDARLARGRELLARQDWQQQLDEARTAQAALIDRVWHADNPGLAQAQVRTVIEDMARGVRLEMRVDVGLGRSVPDVPGLWQVDVQINSRSSIEAALGFVYAVASHPRILVAERLTLTRRTRGRRTDEIATEGLLSAYFRLGNSGDVGDGLVPFRDNPGTASRPGTPQGSPPRSGGTAPANRFAEARTVGDGLAPSRDQGGAASRPGRPPGSPQRARAEGSFQRNGGSNV